MGSNAAPAKKKVNPPWNTGPKLNLRSFPRRPPDLENPYAQQDSDEDDGDDDKLPNAASSNFENSGSAPRKPQSKPPSADLQTPSNAAGKIKSSIFTRAPPPRFPLPKMPLPSSDDGSVSSAQAGNSAPVRQVFGASLDEAVRFHAPVDVRVPLPAIVYRCIQYLDAKDAILEEGIFRLSGSSVVIRQLQERFNSQSDVNLLEDEQYHDIHAVAALLKLYLRELPTDILTHDLRVEISSAMEITDHREKIAAVGVLVQRLPQANATLLKYLIAFLIKISKHSDVNRMTTRNIGIVFAPTLNIPAPVFTMFLLNYEGIFGINPAEYESLSPKSDSYFSPVPKSDSYFSPVPASPVHVSRPHGTVPAMPRAPSPKQSSRAYASMPAMPRAPSPRQSSYTYASMPVMSRTGAQVSRSRDELPAQFKVTVQFDTGDRFTMVVSESIKYQSLVDRINAKLARISDATIGEGNLKLQYRDEEGDNLALEGDEDMEIAISEWLRSDTLQPGGIREAQLYCRGKLDKILRKAK